MSRYFRFPCREDGYNTKEGKAAVNMFISDKLKNHTLVSIVKKRFTTQTGEKWLSFTVSYK